MAAYLVNALAALVTGLAPAQKASPFYHYAAGDPLRHGLALDHTGLLAAAALVLAIPTPLAFARARRPQLRPSLCPTTGWWAVA